MPEKKVAEKGPKIVPIPGRLRAQYVRCGRPNCHCARGNAHGPYYYRRWYSQGKRQKEYVKKSNRVRISTAIAEYQDNRRRKRESAGEFQSLLRGIRQARGNIYALLMEGFNDDA